MVNHLLYEIALRKKKLSPENASNQSVTDIDNQRDARHNLTLQAYNNIICPSKSDVRYVKLNQQFNKIEPAACRDVHTYKLLMMNLIAFEQS